MAVICIELINNFIGREPHCNMVPLPPPMDGTPRNICHLEFVSCNEPMVQPDRQGKEKVC
jgi:hypothetical protein